MTPASYEVESISRNIWLRNLWNVGLEEEQRKEEVSLVADYVIITHLAP